MAALTDVGAAGLAVGQAATAAEARDAAGLGLFVAADANDRVRLLLTETSGSYANSGGAGGSWTLGSAAVREAPGGPLGGGVILPDHADGYIEGSDAVEPTTGLTLWAWLRWAGANSGADGSLILGKARAASPTWADPWWCAQLLIGRTGLIGGAVAAGAGTYTQVDAAAPHALSQDVDHLVAMTHDGSSIRLYVDGTLVASGAAALTITWSGGTSPWRVGRVWSGGGDSLRGRIHALGVCDTVRAAAWHAEMYRRGRGTYR